MKIEALTFKVTATPGLDSSKYTVAGRGYTFRLSVLRCVMTTENIGHRAGGGERQDSSVGLLLFLLHVSRLGGERQDSSVGSLLFLLHVSGLGGEHQDSSVGLLLFLLRVSGRTTLSVSLFTFPLSTHA